MMRKQLIAAAMTALFVAGGLAAAPSSSAVPSTPPATTHIAPAGRTSHALDAFVPLICSRACH
ncbi:hypothetical protein [Streptomyces sp. RKAG293]|uniref:hypothetical protein n=1 Tax=Streptomyces sp. RKAG293 TaxID=2893403 RepID=UPI0020333100|nr:hypothetical protein [Streptomyces sp. RKAG293]MCM2422870.1 hypothetical protein [Streptomyces sp. RKAG293]